MTIKLIPDIVVIPEGSFLMGSEDGPENEMPRCPSSSSSDSPVRVPNAIRKGPCWIETVIELVVMIDRDGSIENVAAGSPKSRLMTAYE